MSPLVQLSNPGNPAKVRWAALLARARMDDQDAVSVILDKAQQQPINDNFVYEAVPDFIYTRQKPLFDFLFTIMQSDNKDCFSSDPDNEVAMLCGYRVMEYIAPYIIDFPIPVEEGYLVADDYPAALQQVRDWYQSNPDYRIVEAGY